MESEIQTYPTEQAEKQINFLVRFLTAPVQVRTYTNLFYLMLSFPLGIFYFVFLVTGLAVGFGLTIIWIGLPILALVLASSWGMAALERRLAIHLLGAHVPPMMPQTSGEPQGLWKTVQDFLGNPVTWKGMAFLFVKLPMGVLSFAVTITLLALSGALVAAPIVYPWADYYISPFWIVDTLGEALLVSAFGMVLLLISMNVLNGLALLWRELAGAMLGSQRFEVPSEPAGPAPEPLPA
jgi:hypothetical protein